MARGLATIGTSAGAIPEATRGGARLVAPEDPEALRLALRDLTTDGAARRQLADCCWQAAQGFTRWPETARIVLDVLNGTVR
jgi:glycosyltransferase involved in cell wall biosynthesis